MSPRQGMTQGAGRAAGTAEEPWVCLKRSSTSVLLTRYHTSFIETKLLKGVALESARYVGKVAVQMKCKQRVFSSFCCRRNI